MPNPVEGLLEVYEDMVEVLLVLEIFLQARDTLHDSTGNSSIDKVATSLE